MERTFLGTLEDLEQRQRLVDFEEPRDLQFPHFLSESWKRRTEAEAATEVDRAEAKLNQASAAASA